MSDTRTYNPKRQLIDVQEFLDKADDSYIMCVSGAMLYALRKVAKTRLLWASTYAAEQYEQSYLLPNAIQWDQIEDVVSEWIADTETIEMCNQSLIDALDAIAENIRMSSCCWEGGPGAQVIDGDQYWGTATPADEPTAFGPGEEFETEEEYETHRCGVANGIVNGLIGSLNGISVLTLASLIASSVLAAVVGIGLLFVPPVAIIMAILGTGLTFAFFQSLASEIEDNKATLVCGLYNSTSAVDAYDNLKQNIDDLSVDLGVLEIQLGPLLDMVMQMAPIDTMNALFTAVDLPVIGGEAVDCAIECEPCPEYTVVYGVYDAGTDQLESEFLSAAPDIEHSQIMYFRDVPEGEYCDPQTVTITVTELVGTPYHVVGDYGYQITNQAGGYLYNHKSVPPASPVSGAANIRLLNSEAPPVPFTVEVTWSVP